MPEIGVNVIGYAERPNYTILAAAPGYVPTAEGVTIDVTTLVAETVARLLASGYTTTPGELVIPAGSILTSINPGVPNSKYQVAGANTVLTVGETYALIKNWSYAWDLPYIGDVTASAEVVLAKLLVGGAGQPTLANVRAAMPTLRTKTV